MQKRNCPNCENNYDLTFDECPICYTPNDKQDKRYKHLTMLSLLKQLSLFIVGFAGFQMIASIIQFIIIIANKAFTTEEIKALFEKTVNNMIVNSVAYIITASILFAIVAFDIGKILKSFKGWKPYVAALACLLAILLFNALYGGLLDLTGSKVDVNLNQENLDSVEQSFPIISIIIFGFIGPICEELTYRVGLFSILKRKATWLAYLISILVFTFIHCDSAAIFSSLLDGDFSNPHLINELLNLPYYAFAGFAFAITYDKFGFASSVCAHISNNVLSFVAISFYRGFVR